MQRREIAENWVQNAGNSPDGKAESKMPLITVQRQKPLRVPYSEQRTTNVSIGYLYYKFNIIFLDRHCQEIFLKFPKINKVEFSKSCERANLGVANLEVSPQKIDFEI